ncbi:uncharacterized protein EURHEDRAFT_378006 [Aspergillus ruber CBS 135680]|uniref:Uncharacterized protein n=1 Tax=Aspergillus ruber (strain CBS 135680) TaxID=1388766 RepID=A0A017SE17_ASPRC|nr:uncharacterized protein EURHEDRAFT_378006 [Aspergillus ruber CBS 135680]EYE95011.1 hypothetical protein EURHEDRAFT_378006 [Aspergillus ruber CBS 135680]
MAPKDSLKYMQPVLSSLIQQHRNNVPSTTSDNTISSSDDDNFQELEDESRTVSYEGDCKLDAKLYTVGDGIRADVDVYLCLCGLHPSIIGKIDYEPIILALDEYAAVIALVGRVVTPIYHRQFWDFIEALEESGYTAVYIGGKNRLSCPRV